MAQNNIDLTGLTVAILVAEGFEQVEMTEPRKALQDAGAKTVLISPETGNVLAFNHHDKGESFPVDLALDKAKPSDYDALLLPGGALNPDMLRTLPKAVGFVEAFFEADKPVAAICHASWTLIEADVVRGRTLTSWPSIATDLRNAGADWVDREVVVDDNLVTSRKPDDIPVFNKEMLALFASARQPAAAAR
jgi:protease I